MSSSFRAFSSKKDTDQLRRLCGVRVAAIQSIAKPLLATLAATLIVGGDGASLYTGPRPAVGSSQHMPYDDALRRWFDRENSKLSIAEQDDPSQVGAFIAASGVDTEHAEIQFDIEQEMRFDRVAKSMRVRAECLIEYDANEQGDTGAVTTAASGGGGEAYAFDDYEFLDDDETAARKRAKTGESTTPAKKPKPKIEQLALTGVWPVLSPCVRLDVTFKTVHAAAGARHELVDAVPHFDRTPGVEPRVTVGDFAAMLRHGAIIHPKQVTTIVTALFPTLYMPDRPPASMAGACVRTLRAPDDHVGDAPPHPYLYSVEASELLAAIEHGEAIGAARVFDQKSVFAGLAPMLLYPRAVGALAEHYGARRWIDVVARGPVLIERLHELMTRRPHVLCFAQLKYRECVDAQRALTDEARYTPRTVGGGKTTTVARDVTADILARRDAAVAAMRWLAQMPELGMANYAALAKRNADTLVLDEARRAVVRVAIDIYASIIRHDLYAGGAMFDETRRRESNGRGATSGHVFSVFGNAYGLQVPSERYDSGYSDGTLCLDVFFAAHAAEQKRLAAAEATAKAVVAARAQTSMSTPPPTTSSLPSKRKTHVDEIEDFLPAKLPIFRPAALQQVAPPPPPTPPTPVATPKKGAAAPKTPTIAPPEPLNEDISRLSELCTPHQFCMALRWLCEQSLLVTFTATGTGPHNAGRPFDVFYTAEMWRTQLTLAETLSDVYRRALSARLSRPLVDPYTVKTAVARLNADVAFGEQARAHLRAIMRREESRQLELTDLRVLLRDAACTEQTRTRHAALLAASAPLQQLRVLHECVREFYGNSHLTHPTPSDAYADMLSLRTHRLVRENDAAVEARMAASSLSDEQKDGIRHVLHNGVTIFMSPGGCGKTFAVECITRCYSLDQIAVCALTGKACEVLQKQVGKVSTIHSLLLGETLHRQKVKRAQARFARLRAALDNMRGVEAAASAAQLREFLDLQAELEAAVGFAESRSPLANVRLLIVDETSLIDEELIRRLLEFLHPLAGGKPGDAALERVLFLGDFNQLGSIEPGSLLQSLCRAFPHCVRMFTRNFRSAGTSIFKLARGIVLRKPGVLDVDFDMRRNEARLRRSTVAANDTPEERAAAEDASVVFYTTNDRTLQSDLRRVLGLLGAVVPPAATGVTPELLTLRDGIHVIAPTNALAAACNTYCREMYFGREMVVDGGETRYALPQPVLYFKVVRGDRLYFRRNFKVVVEVSRKALLEEAAASAVSTLADGDDAECRRAQLLALGATADAQNVDADVDEDAAPRALATEHGACAIEALDYRMRDSGAELSDGTSRRVVTRFYNSEILTLCDLYNTPRRRAPGALCVCGLCPAPPMPRNLEEARARKLVPAEPNTCVRWPHVVPALRRRLGDMSPSATIPYHDHAVTTSSAAHTRRLAVFRTQTGAYKQLDVSVDMSERGAWEHGWATTIHRYQGSGTRTVIIAVPRDTSFVDRSMLYTAVTRAERRVVFMGSADTWRRVAQREPALRRTELWFMLAQAVAAAHTRVAADARLDADGGALARVLRPRSDTERELLDTRRRPTPADAAAVWKFFDRVYAETIARAGLAEL